MKKLLPILLVVIGIGGGVGAGLVLRPAPAEDEAAKEEAHASDEKASTGKDHADAGPRECIPIEEVLAMTGGVLPMKEDADPVSDGEYVKLNNQFVVPVIEEDRVAALVVLSLSVEIPPGEAETLYSREPKLRNVFLQVLFDHANVGGFSGAFTNSKLLQQLEGALLEASYHAVGSLVSAVLITEIARQDV